MLSFAQLLNILFFAKIFIIDHNVYSGPNDCVECANGSNGACAPDIENCQDLFERYGKYICPGETIKEAGVNGCKNCPKLRYHCATTCNWCTPGGTLPPTTTTITTKSNKNDCSTCAVGSPGSSCLPDEGTCVSLPWNTKFLCLGYNMEQAGENGCQRCKENITSICATSCNWCTVIATTPNTDFTVTPKMAKSKDETNTPSSTITSTQSNSTTIGESNETTSGDTATATTSDDIMRSIKTIGGNTYEYLTITGNYGTSMFSDKDKRENRNSGTVIGVVVGLTLSLLFIGIVILIMIHKNKSKKNAVLSKISNDTHSNEDKLDGISSVSDNHDEIYANTKNAKFQNPYYEGDIELQNNEKANENSKFDLNDVDFVTANKNIYTIKCKHSAIRLKYYIFDKTKHVLSYY